jgi:hypothetical protein
MIEFRDADEGYYAWLTTHPDGFVLNVRRQPDAKYVVLHRAFCPSIARRRAAGAYTGHGFRKICADTSEQLKSAAQREGRGDGSFSKRCGLCASDVAQSQKSVPRSSRFIGCGPRSRRNP